MAQLELPEKYAVELEALAQRDARATEDLLAEAMDAYFSLRLNEENLTAGQLERMHQSLAQAERGEHHSEQEVEAFFDEWEKEASSR